MAREQPGSSNTCQMYLNVRFLTQEDELLRQAVAKFGDRAWATVANDVPGRSSKSCSDRLAAPSLLGVQRFRADCADPNASNPCAV